jgi:hypothetical protein
MKLTEYIAMLTDLLNKHGDLEVKNSLYPRCSVDANIKFMRIPKDKRQTQIAFWSEYSDNPEQKGEKIIAL